ncbi:MAG TPA: hypothetical protein VKB78_07905 [Pirellulales bacterium]|nr:hypothetical protein [Pirellulales bacterium]
MVLLIGLFAARSAWAEVGAAPSEASGNAAMKYWQAFALLPALDRDQEKLVDEWNKIPLDAAAMKLIDQSQGSREYLVRGAKLASCDWSLDLEDGIFLRLPFLAKARLLARLTALHARHEFSQKHWESGWNDITALLKLARHCETAPMMIAQLVGYAIEATAIEAAAPYLPEMKSSLPPKTADSLATLPKEPTVAELLAVEKQVGPQWLLNKMKDAEHKHPGSWKTAWNETIDAANAGNEGAGGAKRDLTSKVVSLAQATKWLEELLSLYDEGAKIAGLPPKEFDAAYPAFDKKAKAVNPIAEMFYPNLEKFVPMQRRHQAQDALFRGAVTVVQQGADKLKDMPDPSDVGPIEYRATDNGFELTSKVIFNGKPVSLTVGGGK